MDNNNHSDEMDIEKEKDKIFEKYFKNIKKSGDDINLNKDDNIKNPDTNTEEDPLNELDKILNNHDDHVIEETDEHEEFFKLEQDDDTEAKEISLLDGDKKEIEKELIEQKETASDNLIEEKKSYEIPEEYDIYEPIEKEMSYSDEKGRKKLSKISSIALIVASIVAVFGITFALFAFVDSSKLSSFRYKVMDYEIPTIMGFLEKKGKAVDYKKGISEDVNGRYAIYLYNIDDFDYNAFNKYVEYFIADGYEAYTVSDGAMMLYKFIDKDVLNLAFYPYDNFMEVTFTVYEYKEEDFKWMEEFDDTEKNTNKTAKVTTL